MAGAGVDEKDHLLAANLLGPTPKQRISWWGEAHFGMFHSLGALLSACGRVEGETLRWHWRVDHVQGPHPAGRL